ncbi:MAG: ABC transporter permease [Phycisphaerae bacterium]
MGKYLQTLILPLIVITLCLLVVLAGLALLGYPPVAIVTSWCEGAFGSPRALAAALVKFCPLLLSGLAAGVAFRCGVLNIGVEGQAILGSIGFVALLTLGMPTAPGWIALPLGLGFAILCGGLWAMLAAGLDRWRQVPVVLSTILLNFIALHLLGLLLQGPLRSPLTTAPHSAVLPTFQRLPLLMTNTSLHIGVVVVVIIALVAWLIQSRTTLGFELKACGLNPNAAAVAGMPVARRQVTVLLLSGGFAGLAGGIQVAGVSFFLSEAPTNYGYAGIAVALLGRLHPLGILLAALFFGVLDQGVASLEKDPALRIPHDLTDIVKGVIIMAMLVGSAWLLRRQLQARE